MAHTHYSLFRGHEMLADYAPLPAGGVNEILDQLGVAVDRVGQPHSGGQQSWVAGEYTLIAYTAESLSYWVNEHHSTGNPAAAAAEAALRQSMGS